jgi:hypothetical protein
VSKCFAESLKSKICHQKKVSLQQKNKMNPNKHFLKNGIFFLFVWAFFSACSSKVTFPISTVDPGAIITVDKKKDPNKNYIINVVASNVVSPERLSPPAKMYVIWLVTKDKEVKNAGRYGDKKSSKYRVSALSPVDVKEVFITAENSANESFPLGQEISRVSLK